MSFLKTTSVTLSIYLVVVISLVVLQKRRLNRLQSLFGWDIHFVDATESLSCMLLTILLVSSIHGKKITLQMLIAWDFCILGNSNASWAADVVEPSVKIIRAFLRDDDTSSVPESESRIGGEGPKSIERDLWTQYICKVSGSSIAW